MNWTNLRTPTLCCLLLVMPLLLPAATTPKASLQGAWQRTLTLDGTPMTEVLLLSGNYFSWTQYRSSDGAFGWTKGGSWKQNGKNLELTYEFYTNDSVRVGSAEQLGMSLKGAKLTLSAAGDKMTWTAIDAGVSTPLTGAWLMSGRKNNNGEITRRSTDGPRKTMKILTGGRFQWIAFNTATKQFFGSGGGTYTAVDGKYTEKLEFFSRDNSRVGASLPFDFMVDGADWHHSGLSSAGQPMYEVWSRR